jgi:DNA-binding SARP family transcriptional activator
MRVDGKPCGLGPPKQRALLLTLLLHTDHVVPVQRIIEELWGEAPPMSASANLRSYAAGLRRMLPAGERDRLVARPAGYLLRMDPDDLDVTVFDRGAAHGRRALDRGDATSAVRELESALAVWRGQAAEDVRVGPVAGPLVEALEERRLAVLEDWIEARLAVEAPVQVLPAIRNLTAAEPLRERGWALLMQALAALGDSAGALAAYGAARSALATQLGIEPGPALRHLQRTILNGEPLVVPGGRVDAGPGTSPGSPAPAPAQPGPWRVRCDLPASPRGFVGRQEATTEIAGVLLTAHDPIATRVVAITGGPGVGKTALAVAAAHQLRPHFPDGQWFIQLGGTAGRPRDALELLEQLCLAGGQPNPLPPTVAGRSGALRAVLADRRVLIVLDDAASPEQVRPLLPGTGSSAVIVTGREALTGLVALDAAHALHLGALTPAQSTILLTRLLGRRAVDAGRAAVDEVVRQCAGLPLALRIAAANIRATGSDVARYATRLREERDRLSVLAVHGDQQVAIRHSFDRSYWRLPTDARRLFRLLGTLPRTCLDLELIAAAHGVDAPTTHRTLTRLLAAGLVEHDPDGGYRLNDLLRLYALERAERDETQAERNAALRRLFAWRERASPRLARCTVLEPHPTDPLLFGGSPA